MRLNEVAETLRQHRREFDERYHIRSLGVFGSVARDEQTDESDVDILVEFDESPSLLTFVRLERELSELLDANVDLVMKDALKPFIGERVLHEVVFV